MNSIPFDFNLSKAFSTFQYSQQLRSVKLKLTDIWIRTTDLWCWKWLLCPLGHSYLPHYWFFSTGRDRGNIHRVKIYQHRCRWEYLHWGRVRVAATFLKEMGNTQCDQMVWLFFNIRPFTTMETLPKSIINLPKQVQNFTKHVIRLLKIA